MIHMMLPCYGLRVLDVFLVFPQNLKLFDIPEDLTAHAPPVTSALWLMENLEHYDLGAYVMIHNNRQNSLIHSFIHWLK